MIDYAADHDGCLDELVREEEERRRGLRQHEQCQPVLKHDHVKVEMTAVAAVEEQAIAMEAAPASGLAFKDSASLKDLKESTLQREVLTPLDAIQNRQIY